MLSEESIKFKFADQWSLASRSGNNLIWKWGDNKIFGTLKHTTSFKYAKLLRRTEKRYDCTSSPDTNGKCVHTILEYSDGKIDELKLCIGCNN